MQEVAQYSDVRRMGGEEVNDPPYEAGTIYQLLKCPACALVTLRSYFWNDWMESEADAEFKTLFPIDTRIPLGLPSKIEAAFRAAIKVKPIDANAFGVLIGRVFEFVCADRSATGRTLNDKLKDLSTRGEIPAKLVEVADKLRGFRNVGAHAELGELTAEEVPIVEDLCRALLDYIYTAPHLAHKAEAHLARLAKKRPKRNGQVPP